MTGVGKLVRLILRRDRWLLPTWVVLFGIMPMTMAASIKEIFPTDAGLKQYAAASENSPAFVALYGRLFGSSLGELSAWRAGFLPVMIGLISLLLVIRHTRAEEEAGRRELLASTVVGRHAGLAAALIVTFVADLVVGVIAALTLSRDLPAAGSWAFGAELVVAGWVFAAIGAVAAQLTTGAGSARGIALGALGAAYVLRVAGDVSALSDGPLAWLSWLSPIHWAHDIRPYGDEQWQPLVLAGGVAAVLVVAAVVLSGRRDVGAGLLPPRLGPASAGAALGSPLGLAWRLHRGLLLAWAIGFAVLGLVFGSLGSGFEDLVRDNAIMRQMAARMGGAGGLIDGFMAGMLNLLGLVAGGYAVQAALRLRAEEIAGHAEQILGTAVGRLRWAASHLVFALVGPAVALLAGGTAMGVAHGVAAGDVGRELPRILAGAIVPLPAVWVLAAVATALIGLAPRAAGASWGAVAVCVLIGIMGTAMDLNQWILDISPFTHLPRLPGAEVTAVPLVVLGALAVVLTVAGLVGLRRRDVPV